MPLFTELVEITQTQFGEHSKQTADVYLKFAELCVETAQYSEAENLAEKGRTVLVKAGGANSAQLSEFYYLRGLICKKRGDYDKALFLLLLMSTHVYLCSSVSYVSEPRSNGAL